MIDISWETENVTKISFLKNFKFSFLFPTEA